MARSTKELLFVSLVISVIFTATAARTEEQVEQQKQPKDFKEEKAEVLKDIDTRISGLQKFKTCASAAKDHDELRRCMDTHREEMRKLMSQKQRSGMGPGRIKPGGPRQQPPTE